MRKILFLMLAIAMASMAACDMPRRNEPHVYFGNIDERTIAVSPGDTVYLPPDPTIEGYDFMGWYLDETFETEFDRNEPIHESITLWARFVPKRYELTLIVEDFEGYAFDLKYVYEVENGEDHRIDYGESIPFEDIVNAVRDILETDDYLDLDRLYDIDISDWAEDREGETMFPSSTMPARDLTLYLIWEPRHYPIHLNNTWLDPYPVTYKTTTLHLPEPTKTGHEFLGWYWDEDFGTEFDPEAFNSDTWVLETVDIFAKWDVKEYEITFHPFGGTHSGGDPYASLTVEYMETIPEIPAPDCRVDEGVYFIGWYTDNMFRKPFDENTMPAHNVSLYALWMSGLYEPPEFGVPAKDVEDFIAALVEATKRSVVLIENTKSNEQTTSGSGVIFQHDDEGYYVLTNYHVIEDHVALNIWYETNGMLMKIPFEKIEPIGYDSTTDIAVLKWYGDIEEYLDEAGNPLFNTIPFAHPEDVRIGQFAFAIGNPHGAQYYGTFTMGIVSGLSRFIVHDDIRTIFLQHDAAISPGNSGGALVNLDGELIGINTLKAASSKDIGFALPIRVIEIVIADILALDAYGEVERAVFGITTALYAADCGQISGVCIDGVAEGSTAEAAGLLAGDIIVGMKEPGAEDFVTIRNFSDLYMFILDAGVGAAVTVQYERNGQEFISDIVILQAHSDE